MFYLSLLPPTLASFLFCRLHFIQLQPGQTCRKPHKYLVPCDGCGSVYGLQTRRKARVTCLHVSRGSDVTQAGKVESVSLTSGPVTCYSGPGLARKCRKCPPGVPGPGSSARSRLTSVGRNQPSPRDSQHLANKHQSLKILSKC